MRTKRTAFNIISNIVSKLVTLVFGILIPKLYIDYFGSEMNGLLASITGIFTYLNLLEAGVGGASIQALYAPLYRKDQNKINGVISATNRYYKYTGVYFLACVSTMAFIYPLLVKTDISYSTIVAIILLSAVPSALSYFVQGKYNILLSADNRGYVITTFNMIFNTVSSIVKIILILHGFNIITVQTCFSIICAAQVIAVYVYAKKAYPQLNLSVMPDNRAISKKNSVLIHQISGVVFFNTGVLILTMFCDLKVVSVYTIYNMIFGQAGFLPSIFSSSLTAGFGQLYVENKDKFKRLFDFFEAYYLALVFVVFLVAYVMILPFLKLYTAGVTDINYIDAQLPLLFLCVNLLSNARWPASTVINIAGHFKQTQWRALLEMTINLVVSVVLVNITGIYGVLLGTITALFYRMFDMIIYSNRHILHRSSVGSIRRFILNVIIAVVILLVYRNLNMQIHNYLQFTLIACISFAGISVIYFGITTIIEKEARAVLCEYGDNIFRKLSKFRKKVIEIVSIRY